jgi:hypothetical protein
MTFLRKAALLVWLVGMCASTAVNADPIRVQTGSMGFDTGDPPGFVFEGEGFRLSGVFQPVSRSPALECLPCFPGATINLTSVFGGESVGFNLGQGTVATIGGTTFVQPGSRPIDLFGTFEFDATSVTVPPITEDFRVVLTAPFTFNGRMAGFRETKLFETDLEGQGSVLFALTSRGGFAMPGVSYSFQGLTYRFEPSDPIPEPATMLLCGTALGGLWLRERGKRRRRRD